VHRAQFSFTAPSAGQTIVTVNGSGYCQNSGSDLQVAEFDSEIVSPPGGGASFAGPGGHKFKFTLPASGPLLSGNGVFNFGSVRLGRVSSPSLGQPSFSKCLRFGCDAWNSSLYAASIFLASWSAPSAI